MKRKLFLFAVVLIASMQFVSAQDTAAWYPVTGAKNMGFKHKIAYGEFQTSRIKVKGTKSNTTVLGVLVDFKNQYRYKFNQMCGDAEAKVVLTENGLPEGMNELNNVFNLHLGNDVSFVAKITLPDQTEWTFASDVSRREREFTCGAIVGPDGQIAYSIYGNNYSRPQDVMLYRYHSYYEIRLGEKVIGKVDTKDDGKVWVDPTLDTNTKLLVSSVLTSYLIRKWQCM